MPVLIFSGCQIRSLRHTAQINKYLHTGRWPITKPLQTFNNYWTRPTKYLFFSKYRDLSKAINELLSAFGFGKLNNWQLMNFYNLVFFTLGRGYNHTWVECYLQQNTFSVSHRLAIIWDSYLQVTRRVSANEKEEKNASNDKVTYFANLVSGALFKRALGTNFHFATQVTCVVPC